MRHLAERSDGGLLRHLQVSVSSFVFAGEPSAEGAVGTARRGVPGRNLAAVLACIRSWANLTAVERADLVVHTNDVGALEPLVRSSGWPALRDGSAPPGLTARLAPWSSRAGDVQGGKRNPFELPHAHLHDWAAIVADRASGATAFINLEDDVCPDAAALAAWAADEAALVASGAAAAGFQRGFYRYEVTRSPQDLPPMLKVPHQACGRRSAAACAEFVASQAARWREKAGVALGERLVVDEYVPRVYRPAPPRRCDARPPCDLQAGVQWCAAFPLLVVGRGDASAAAPLRVFAALKNPYSAITASSRALVTAFLLHSAGWDARWNGTRLNATALFGGGGVGASHLVDRAAPGGGRRRPAKFRMRHKAYAVREYGSCTLHYAHDFLDFHEATGWPALTRRVLVPLVLAALPLGAAQPGRPVDIAQAADPSWRLDPAAAVHHRSDRLANGPRKFADKYACSLRESEVVACRSGKG